MPYANTKKQSEYQAAWIRKRRAGWLEENGPCVQCGSSADLQVDHKVPGDKVSHRIWSWSLRRREAELAKCQVLCAECHRAKSATECCKGERVGTSKLTDAIVIEMRRLNAEEGLGCRRLGRRFGVHRGTAADVILRRSWTHI